MSQSRSKVVDVTERVVVDEWTVTLFGAPALSGHAADQLRDAVEQELAALAGTLTRALAPAASVKLLPR